MDVLNYIGDIIVLLVASLIQNISVTLVIFGLLLVASLIKNKCYIILVIFVLLLVMFRLLLVMIRLLLVMIRLLLVMIRLLLLCSGCYWL